MFTQENVPSCTASVVNVKHAVRKKLLMYNGLKTSVSKKTAYELDGREFKSLCVVIFLFDSTSFFFAPKHRSEGLPPGTLADGNPENSTSADFSSTQLATFTIRNLILSEKKKVAFVFF
jgi:hypothetical protein